MKFCIVGHKDFLYSLYDLFSEDKFYLLLLLPLTYMDKKS